MEKETKEKYSHMLAQNDKLCKVLNQKECEIDEENLRKENKRTAQGGEQDFRTSLMGQ